MSNFIKYCKIFDVILTSFQQKEKNPAIEELHLFSNHVITRWKIKIFFSVISISSNCNFTSNTKHKCTTDLFCWICKSRLSIIKFANFVSIIIIISWLFSEPTEKCNALNLFWQLFFLRSVVHRKMYFTCQKRFQMPLQERNK